MKRTTFMVAPETQSHLLPSTWGKVQRSGKTKEPKPGTQTHGGPGGQQSLSAPVPPPQAYLEAGHTRLGHLMTNRIRQSFQGPLTAPGRKLQTREGHLDPATDPGSTGVATES